jgi:hypothetical protein
VSYDDWDFHPANVFIIAAALVIAFAIFLGLVARIQGGIDRKEERTRIAGYETCSKMADEALRTLCVSQVK